VTVLARKAVLSIVEVVRLAVLQASQGRIVQNVNLDAMEIDVRNSATPPVEETTLVIEIVELVARAVILVT
ncbi:hypothetical protein RRG08_018486, partial [Elysia crispata]